MRILVLDDNPYRHQVYREVVYPEHEVVNVYSYMDTIHHLNLGGWDLVHLDHDLGDLLPEGKCADTYLDGWGKVQEYTGYDVAKYICAMDPKPTFRVVIHSVNGSGGNAMRQVLERMGISVEWNPFTEPREDDSHSGCM